MHSYFVYILVSASGTLYVGVTNDFVARSYQHATAGRDTFTGRYHVNRLVYAEAFEGPISAIEREKQIKRWRREKKIALIDWANPEWKTIDLS